MPWRDNPVPYHVWIAEIMAQQTRLETMLPYYQRWLERFPNIEALASADLQDALVLWEGLGYYQRARNLHAAALEVVEHHGGQLPESSEVLRKLPGIGPYTAGAIASVAFGLDEPAVDGNAIRVLSRLFDIQHELNSSAGKRAFWEAARQILPSGQASDFNQGLMDLGARVCLPRNPRCETCPLKTDCEAFKLGIQDLRPVRKTSAELPLRHYVSLVSHRGDKVRLQQRPQDALLGGMWEFPNIEADPDLDEGQVLRLIRKEWGLSLNALRPLMEITHTYSHFQANVRAFIAELPSQIAESSALGPGDWVQIEDLDQRPMGKIDRSIANRLRGNVG